MPTESSKTALTVAPTSPGSGEAERNHWENLSRLRVGKDEVKFVIADMGDWEFARRVIEEYRLTERAKEILISPVHGVENLS